MLQEFVNAFLRACKDVFAVGPAGPDGIPHHPTQQGNGYEPRSGLNQVPRAAELQKVEHDFPPLGRDQERLPNFSAITWRYSLSDCVTRYAKYPPTAASVRISHNQSNE